MPTLDCPKLLKHARIPVWVIELENFLMIKTQWFRLVGVLLLLVAAFGVRAADQNITGNWLTSNHNTNKLGATIQIFAKNGQYFGKIVKTLESDKICSQCSGDRHNQPMLGLTMLRNVSAKPVNGVYLNGWILNPDTGKEYQCSLQLANDGKQLKIKVTKGFFSKTKVWKRVD